MAKKVSTKDVHGVLADRFLRADRLVDTNSMELAVYGNEAEEQILAVASLDNLAKGASGAARPDLNDHRPGDHKDPDRRAWSRTNGAMMDRARGFTDIEV